MVFRATYEAVVPCYTLHTANSPQLWWTDWFCFLNSSQAVTADHGPKA